MQVARSRAHKRLICRVLRCSLSEDTKQELLKTSRAMLELGGEGFLLCPFKVIGLAERNDTEAIIELARRALIGKPFVEEFARIQSMYEKRGLRPPFSIIGNPRERNET